jgi:hypothetical protein
MVNKARRLAHLMVCALLCGCAAMSESECGSANWFQIGKRDARMGVRPQLANYARQCAAFKAFEKEYLEGWQLGYWEFSEIM